MGGSCTATALSSFHLLHREWESPGLAKCTLFPTLPFVSSKKLQVGSGSCCGGFTWSSCLIRLHTLPTMASGMAILFLVYLFGMGPVGSFQWPLEADG